MDPVWPYRSTDNWQLATDNCFSKSFPACTLGAACEDTTTSSSQLGDTPPSRESTSAQVTFECDAAVCTRVHHRRSHKEGGPAILNGKYAVSVTALNVTNLRVQLDNSLTFGAFHWNEPRQVYAEFRWRVHY